MANSNPNTIAANLAVLLYQARHLPEAVDALNEAARVLHLALGGEEFTALTIQSCLEINGRKVSESTPGVRDVNEHLLIHGVRHLMVPVAAGPEDLLAIARVLSAYPGAYADWNAVLAALGPTRARIQISGAGEDTPLLHYAEEEPAIVVGGESGGIEFLDPLAPDLTLTQFLDETLTLVVFLLVLRTLPAESDATHMKRHRLPRALLAIAVESLKVRKVAL